MIAAMEARERTFPVLDVDWIAPNGYALSSERYAGGDHPLPDRFAKGRAAAQGFGSFSYGPGLRPGSIRGIQQSVTLTDLNGELKAFLEKYQPRRSPAATYMAAVSLQPTDWTLGMRGLVTDWRFAAGRVELIIESDDRPLRAPVPRDTIDSSTFGAAADPAVFGQAFPLALGIFDSYGITGGGMLTAVNVVYDETLGYTWVASLGHLTIDRVCVNGVRTVGTYTTTREVRGGVELTLIHFAAGSQPDKTATVTFDAHGPDDTGRTTGETVVNPVRQLRILLGQYSYAGHRIGTYISDAFLFDTDTLDALEALFEAQGAESAVLFGGAKDAQTGLSILEGFLRQNKFVRAWWTPEGKIAMAAIDAYDADPDAEGLDAEFSEEPEPLLDPDATELCGSVAMPFLYGYADQKFYNSLLAVDAAPAGDRAVDPIDNLWSPGRYTDGA